MLNVFTQLFSKKEPITPILVSHNIPNTLVTSFLKFTSTISPTIPWKSDTMAKSNKFLSVIGKLNALFKLSMLGMNNSRMKIIFKLVVSTWLMLKLTFQLLQLNLWLFLSLHWLLLYVVLKTKKDHKVPFQASLKMNHQESLHQTTWSKILFFLNKKRKNEKTDLLTFYIC